MKDLEDARRAYAGAFETLEALRRELATGSPDAQLSFLEEVEGIYREYVDLLLWEPKPEQVHVSQAREVIASLQAVELENFLRQACPENNLKEIDKVLEKDAKTTAFIYPIVLDNRIEVILKLPEVKDLKRFNKFVARNDVEKLVAQLQLDLEEEYTFEAVRDESKQLYEWLLKDVDQYLEKEHKNINTLVFALDTNLRNIPLAALVYDANPESTRYLVDKYAIALAPRLDLPSSEVLQDRKLRILAAGLTEPDPGVVNERQKRKFSKLRYVNQELNVLETLEKSNSRVSVTKLSEENFKTKQLQSKINTSTFQILHLATHGEFSSLPENTFILAYDKPIKVNEIGNVFRTQAQNQLEPIELLVLSACETAAGDQRATLGISGVGVRAGARSAIASLWTLDDKISVEFTKELYKQLTNPTKLTKAKALQEAQRRLKDSRGREHPRYWAPYILLGNWL
ncbi:MAG: CHAT domain-containing protein [Brasilonema sp.]